MPKKRLTIGLQSFSRMIKGEYIYVDKTEDIYNLISAGSYYFLSRPHRFGKSLLVSTLSELFSGNRALFKTLAIDSKNYSWQEHPVIVLNFAGMDSKSPEILEKDISWSLSNIGKLYDIDLASAPSLTTQLKLLIQGLGSRNNVALLIDEYDYPIVNNIDNPELAEKCRNILRNLFSALKDTEVDKYLHFVFISGVSKFSKTSIFSELNNLEDISLEPIAAKLLGYTIEEIKTAYHEYLEKLSGTEGMSPDEILSRLTFWYNGYQFTDPQVAPEARMYNPFSVMMYLRRGVFGNYWFDTGTPTFLMRLMKKLDYPLLESKNMVVGTEETTIEDVYAINILPLLWQTGYLTIESYDQKSDSYTLCMPNEEVKISFNNSLLRELTQKQGPLVKSSLMSLSQSLERANLETFFETLQSFFAHIPYSAQLPQEKYYQTIFYPSHEKSWSRNIGRRGNE